jgi:phage replication-related protein YjqB (UPF0714/DUF867 family)
MTDHHPSTLFDGVRQVGSAFLSVVGGPDLDETGERVAFDADSFAALGLTVPADFGTPGSRRQLLVNAGDGAVMFTVAAAFNSGGPVVQMGPAALARLRLQVPPTAPVQVTSDVLSTGELVETTILRPGATVAVVAPHGGFIERTTDTQAECVASDARLLADAWICRGAAGGAFRRWHVTSDDLSENSFGGLQGLLGSRHDYCVSFHGFGQSGGLDVIVGGRVGLATKQRVREQLETRLCAFLGRPVAILLATSTSDPFPGLAPDNVVNRLATRGGLQIEQASSLRSTDGAPDVVTDVVIDELVGLCRRPGGT